MENKPAVNKRLALISTLIIVLISAVILSGIGTGLSTILASAFYFDSLTAIAYAGTWWDGRNPAYHDYGTVDCANFVSQCLKAGGLNLSVSPYVDSWGCIPSCDNLNAYLVNYLGVENTRNSTGSVPSWFGPGDVAIFGDSSDPWRHSVFAVAVEGGNTVCDAHSNNRYHVPISFYLGSGSTFTLCNYYDINVTENPNLISTSLNLTVASAARGKPVQATATLTQADGTAIPGKMITFYIQQKVKGGVIWVAVASPPTDASGTATVMIPAKSITMQQQPIKAVFVGDDIYSGSVGTTVINRQ
jgi:hypothetical protein